MLDTKRSMKYKGKMLIDNRFHFAKKIISKF